MLKLNLGCGGDKREGWVNIDINPKFNPDRVMDVRKLDYPDNSVDEILALDILEHFSYNETLSILKEWVRVLKPSGIIAIRVPSLKRIFERYLGINVNKYSHKLNGEQAAKALYGSQEDEYTYHKAGFDREYLVKLLTKVGITVFEVWDDNCNLFVKGRKNG